MKNKILSVFIFLLIKFTNIYSQNVSSFYTSFDQKIGISNTNLTYGVSFKEKHRTSKNNHNYFLSNYFSDGNITYKNETFYKVKIKYDLIDDLIILNINSNKENKAILLEKEFISNFYIKNKKFINTNEFGFIEEISTDKLFSIYKKHKKKKIEKMGVNKTYYVFEKEDDDDILYYKKKYYLIKSKKDFIKLFPENKKKIKTFYKKNDFLQKNKLIKNLMNLLLAKSIKE